MPVTTSYARFVRLCPFRNSRERETSRSLAIKCGNWCPDRMDLVAGLVSEANVGSHRCRNAVTSKGTDLVMSRCNGTVGWGNETICPDQTG